MAVKKVYGAFVKLPLLGSNTRPPYIHTTHLKAEFKRVPFK